MKINVKLFGPDAKLAGTREAVVQVESSAPTAALVRAALKQQFPALAKVNFRLAVNHEFAADDQPVSPRDEVAVIGMVSGG